MKRRLRWRAYVATALMLAGCFIPSPVYGQADGVWTRLTTDNARNSPARRDEAASAWDDRANRLLVFGGYSPDISRGSLNDLWEYTDLGGWRVLTELDEPGSPPRRSGAAAAWDSQANRLLVFGGHDWYDKVYFGDLWQYTATGGWQQLTVDGAPEAPIGRRYPHAAWDAAADRLLLFGGVDGRLRAHIDVWQYTTAGGWLQLSADGAPGGFPVRRYSVAVWDDRGHRLLVFGGLDDALQLRNDLWQFTTSGGWQQLIPDGAASAPSRRQRSNGVWDPQDQRLLLFGGDDLRGANDLWQFTDGGGWLGLSADDAATFPTRRSAPSLAWDGQARRLLLFGGRPDPEIGHQRLSDLWEFGAP